jgi:hypothetical protein
MEAETSSPMTASTANFLRNQLAATHRKRAANRFPADVLRLPLAAAVCDENGGTRQSDDGPQPVLFTSIRLKHFDSVKTWLTLHRASDLIRS